MVPGGYIYIEFPKCLYNPAGLTMEVSNSEEEAGAKEFGWMTAEEYHNPHRLIVPPTPPARTFPWRKPEVKTEEGMSEDDKKFLQEEEDKKVLQQLEAEEAERKAKELENDSAGSDN